MIREFLRDHAESRPSAPAILAPDFATLDYRGLYRHVVGAGAALARTEVKQGSTVALVCSNGPQAATAFLGIAAYTACAPLNPAYRAAEFEFYLADLAPAALVLESGLDSAARNVAVKLGIPVLELPSLNEFAGIDGASHSSADDDVALLLHTSGTTSRPKLVPLTQGNLVASARHIAASLALDSKDRCLNVMPLFHIHGLEAALLASLISGGSVVCCPGFAGVSFFDWIEEFRPTWYTAVPTIHQSVVARAKDADKARSLRFIRSSSSALAPSLMHEVEQLFQVPVIEAYGMTEAAHQMTSNPLPPDTRKPGSVGRPAGPEVSIMDEVGRLLPRETRGEVVIRGPNVTSGYASNAEANATSFTGGWFRTGDLGYLDGDGYLFLSGRSKEIINRGGEKIAPREIDEALLAHPAVAQAVAFAAPHSLLGEGVAAAVVTHPGLSTTEQELREFVATRLVGFKVPEKIVFLDEIPKGPTGKIQRIGLADKLGVQLFQSTGRNHEGFVEPRTPFEKQIAELFSTTLKVERIGIRDNFFDAGGDSLLTMILLTKTLEATTVDVPELVFLADPTVQGVCRHVESASRRQDLRLVIRPGQDAPTLFCIPGSHGNLSGFFNLAQHLDKDQPVTGFRLVIGEQSIEQMATLYLAEVIAAQPAGPYHLLGICTGGFVAYEMAQQLVRQGQSVGLLALADCYNHAWSTTPITRFRYRLSLLGKRILYQSRNVKAAGLRGTPRYVASRFTAFLETTRNRAAEIAYAILLRAGAKPTTDARIAIRYAAARYVPQRWPGRLTLFRADVPRVDAYDFPDMGWRGVAAEITIQDVPGSHEEMLSEPQVKRIADELNGAMKQ